MTNQNEELPKENNTAEQTEKVPNKLVAFIFSHKLIFSLLFALIILFLWAFIKISVTEKRFEKQIQEQKSLYENKIDSLTVRHFELTSKMLSLAVRSELTRDNKEQVNQFFLSFIKEQGVTKVMLVDAVTAKVLISTDKKDEGTFFADLIIATDKTVHQIDGKLLRIVTPVMGLNSKIGILVIEYML
jgi:hypothetical protein